MLDKLTRWSILLSAQTTSIAVSTVLFFVPLLAKLGLTLSIGTSALYFAAILGFVGVAIVKVKCPTLISLKTYENFVNNGGTPNELREIFINHEGSLKDIPDAHVKTRLENKNNSSKLDLHAYNYVKKFLDDSLPRWRRVVATIYAIALLLALINAKQNFLLVINSTETAN